MLNCKEETTLQQQQQQQQINGSNNLFIKINTASNYIILFYYNECVTKI